jgi:hypothetical protein
MDFENLLEEMKKTRANLHKALSELEIEGGPKVDTQLFRFSGIPYRFPFSDLKDASASMKTLEKCLKDAKALRIHVNKLSDLAIEHFEKRSEVIVSVDLDDPDNNFVPVRDAHRSLKELVRALEGELRSFSKVLVKLRKDHFGTGDEKTVSGRGKALSPYEIALEVGWIYMEVRNGEVPTYSKDFDSRPNTLFTRVVEGVFDALGIKANFRAPCKKAAECFKKLVN